MQLTGLRVGEWPGLPVRVVLRLPPKRLSQKSWKCFSMQPRPSPCRMNGRNSTSALRWAQPKLARARSAIPIQGTNTQLPHGFCCAVAVRPEARAQDGEAAKRPSEGVAGVIGLPEELRRALQRPWHLHGRHGLATAQAPKVRMNLLRLHAQDAAAHLQLHGQLRILHLLRHGGGAAR